MDAQLNIDDFFLLGELKKPHGIKGEFKAYLDVQDITDYLSLDFLYIKKINFFEKHIISKITPINQNEVIIGLENINSRTDAENLCGSLLYLPLEYLPTLSQNGFYYHDIIGFQAESKQYGTLGIIKEIFEMPAHDLLAIDYKETEILVPLVDEYIEKVDFETQTIILNLPEGYLNLYLDLEE